MTLLVNERRTRLFATFLLLALAPSAAQATPQWTLLGPAPLDVSKGPSETPNMGPTAGRASAVAVDPTNPGLVYAGFAQGGVWKSTDDGGSWTPLFDQMASTAIGSVVIDPSNHQTIWVGTGEAAPYAGRAGKGLYVSTDGGATWSKRGGNGFDDKAISKILFDGTDVYVTVTFSGLGRGDGCTNTFAGDPGQGLYRSIDGGQTFTLLKSGAMTDVEIDASATPHRLFASDFNAGAFKSDDAGVSWQPLNGLPAMAQRIELAISAENPAYVYAGLSVNGKSTVYVSKDHGASFAEMPGAPDYCESQCYYDNSVLVDPTNPDKLYLGGSLCGVWGTTNATAATPAWSNVSAFNKDCGAMDANWYLGFVHPDVHALSFDPSNPAIIYASTDGGLARSKDSGATWQTLNAGISTTQLYGVCVDPNDASVIYAGSQDNGSMKSANGSLTWKGLIAGDGGPCAIDSGNSKNVLLTVAGGSIYASANGFASIPFAPVFSADPTVCTTQPGCGDRVGFTPPLIGDPTNAHTFYFGTYRLWKNDQAGAQKGWTAISPDLTRGTKSVTCAVPNFGKGDDIITAIAVSPTAGGTLYTGSAAGLVQRTTDGGTTWTAVSKMPLPERYVSSIAVDPIDPNRVYVSFSGFSSETPGAPGHVFRSNDGGETWILADTPGDEPVDTLVAHPVGPGLLYAGTESGVLYSEDGGANWNPLATGLPHTAVYSLAFQRKAAILVAGTHGRSVWSLTMPPAQLSAMPASLNFSVELGQGDPAPQTVLAQATDTLGGSVAYMASADSDWITGFPVSGAAAGAEGTPVTVAVSTMGLAAGSYDGNVTLMGTTNNIVVPVHLDITTPPPPPPKKTPTPKGGCGCRVAPEPFDPSMLAFGLFPLGWLVRRRVR